MIESNNNETTEKNREEYLTKLRFELLMNNIEVPSFTKWITVDQYTGCVYAFSIKPILKDVSTRNGVSSFWDVNTKDRHINDMVIDFMNIFNSEILEEYWKISLVSVEELFE